MSVTAFMTRHATLRRLISADDGAGGATITPTAIGAIRCKIGTISSQMKLFYQKHGWEYVVRLQMEPTLPQRQGQIRTLDELFRSAGERLRIDLGPRTLTPVAVSRPNEGDYGPNDFVNVDCVETPDPVGYQDVL